MSASKQRYSIWIGKKKAPIDSAEAIEQMLKDQRYQFEMHTRNWNQGGYIVSCLILYINVFLFSLTPNVSGFFFFLISTFQFLRSSRWTTMPSEAWSMWEFLNSQKFYMGTHPGADGGDTRKHSSCRETCRNQYKTKGTTYLCTCDAKIFKTSNPRQDWFSSFPASVGSFKIFLYFKFFFECHYISFPTNTFHGMSHCIAFQFEFQHTSVLQVFSVS